MGVEGEKLWDDEKQTQDFTGVCTPTFVTPNIKANAKLQYWSRRHLPAFYFWDFRRGTHILDMLMQALWNETQTNPLGATFYSCVPYLLGPGQAMQYSFRSRDRRSSQDSAAAAASTRQLPARQHDPHARRDGCRIRHAHPAADRSFPDADRKQCGAVARAIVSAGAGGDVANSEAGIRQPGAVRLYPQSEIQSVALPARRIVRSAIRAGRANECTTSWRSSVRR